MVLLSVSNLACGYYRDVEVLHDVSLKLPENSIVAIIGPNGAGKSTLLNTIFGFLRPRKGEIECEGENISGLPPHVTKQKGISYITQIPSVFPQLTVEENILLGAWIIRKNKKVVQERMEEIYSDFEALRRKRKSKATYLSGGELKMLELAKGIIVHPKIILFDEPTAGLAPKIANEIYQRLIKYKSSMSILLVDQNIRKAIEVADYLYFLEGGTIKTEGSREMFRKNIREIIKSSLID